MFVALASCRHVIIETEDTETRGKDGTGVGGHGNLDFCIIIVILNTIDVINLFVIGRESLPPIYSVIKLYDRTIKGFTT